MPELTPQLAAEIVAACEARATSIAAAFGSALGGEFELTVGKAAVYDAKQPPAGFDGPGLVVLLRFGDTGAVVALPESTGLLPDWYRQPDATGQAKLYTLAQELSVLVDPESIVADEYRAERVTSLSAAMQRSGIVPGAQHVQMRIARGASQGDLSLIWPLTALDRVFDRPTPPFAAQTDPPDIVNKNSDCPADAADPGGWPNYMHNVLRIRVPVIVTLASQRTPIHEIIEMGPGTIVKFEKTCDQPLDLSVGDRPIATGEVVKVGDKFGLRIGMIVKHDAETAATNRYG